jgi:hypothetical protein
LLRFDGQLVHAISRLDPYVKPNNIPPIHGRRSGLLNRFLLTSKKTTKTFSLTYTATAPNDMLSVLLLNKESLFLGVSVFYGTNTFAFSSVSLCVAFGECILLTRYL